MEEDIKTYNTGPFQDLQNILTIPLSLILVPIIILLLDNLFFSILFLIMYILLQWKLIQDYPVCELGPSGITLKTILTKEFIPYTSIRRLFWSQKGLSETRFYRFTYRVSIFYDIKKRRTIFFSYFVKDSFINFMNDLGKRIHKDKVIDREGALKIVEDYKKNLQNKQINK